MIIVLLILTGFILYLSFKYKTKSLNIGSRAVAHGLSSLGKEEEGYLHCPKCSKRVKRTNNTYCSNCNLYF